MAKLYEVSLIVDIKGSLRNPSRRDYVLADSHSQTEEKITKHYRAIENFRGMKIETITLLTDNLI